MINEPGLGVYFRLLIVSGLMGYGFHSLGAWADGGDYSVLKIIFGGPPEFTLWSNVALLCYGLAISCLGVLLATIGMMNRATMPGTRIGTKDVMSGVHHPAEAAGQFQRYGCVLMLASLLIIGGPVVSIVLCIWQLLASLA